MVFSNWRMNMRRLMRRAESLRKWSKQLKVRAIKPHLRMLKTLGQCCLKREARSTKPYIRRFSSTFIGTGYLILSLCR